MDQKDLKKLRKDLNMTQQDMAFLCGVTLRTYSKWENEEIPNFIQSFLELLKLERNRRILIKKAMQRLDI